MMKVRDRSFDWVPALAIVFGAAVLIPSLAALVIALGAALNLFL